MKRKYKRLINLSAIFTLGAIASVSIIYANKTSIKKEWYDGLENAKFEVRDPFFQQQSTNSSVQKINNDFELKLLLNHKYDSLDELSNSEYLEKQNLNFVNVIKTQKIKFKDFIVSKETPIVWFYFDNESDREKFVKKLQENENIYKFILYKNNFSHEIKQSSYSNSYHDNFSYNSDRDLTKYDILNKNDVFRTVNFTEQRDRDLKLTIGNSHSVGVLEFDGGFIPYITTNNFDNNDIKILDRNSATDDHSIIVSSVASGDEGIDTQSKLYFSQWEKDGVWQQRFEELVRDNHVKIINHSYGYGLEYDWEHRFYDEKSYIVDYLSRKYGVVNVFASGNENGEYYNGKERGWINSWALSYNSIVVGALNKIYRNDVRDNKIADYSNYKLDKDKSVVGLAKPFVVAPGAYWFKGFSKIKEGTSLAAPVITGLISTLLRIRPYLDNDDYRLASIKSILSASAVSTNDTEQTKKSNGFSDKYGSGIPDFEKMKEATDNLKHFSVYFNDKRDIVGESKSFYVYSGKTIKASLSWLFNAGLLDKKDEPTYNANVNWWWFLGPIGGMVANIVEADRLKEKLRV
ncbi:S8 family serine peptidase [Mycoplasma sp. 3686d]|uniref:S8 family serine peptidase n=1 Tax=Mycoplasma sp. 3686d TaxID=2967300 RepID=UPI00211C160C|nr:S8 family serine peptidase [Mycoplasma sp. 3686d]UUM24867.1 S8 family serine peptidase [Mycoplasma sp. 3686d]